MVAHRNEVTRGDTQSGQRADEGGAVIVIGDRADIAIKVPVRKAMLDQRLKAAHGGKMLKEYIRSVTAPRCQADRIIDHGAEERTRKCFHDGPVVNRYAVPGALHVRVRQHVPDACVGVLIEKLADRRARLPGLADQRAQAAREHPLRGPVTAYDIEAPPQWTIERGSDNRPTCGNVRDDLFAFRLRRPEAGDFPRNRRRAPVEPAYGARPPCRGTPHIDAYDCAFDQTTPALLPSLIQLLSLRYAQTY